MVKAIIPLLTEKDVQVMEALLSAGHLEHKFAVRLQTVLNRSRGVSTNTAASVLGIDHNSVSNYVKRYNEGGVEALLRDKTRKPGKAPIPATVKTGSLGMFARKNPRTGRTGAPAN